MPARSTAASEGLPPRHHEGSGAPRRPYRNHLGYARFVEETHAVYNVTKAAVWALVRSAAIDLARHNIRVNGVAPGVADTPLAALVTRDAVLGPEYLKTIPLGRFAQPADIAAAVAFLASPDAAYITGQNIVLDGGQTLGIPGSLGP